ncbi:MULTISPECIES: UvrD-helicase domain-containing protein [Bacillus subtilis group]|uniref:UvrD-helicase domain-containing protein n=1 Tax=Bacillus subtilis group TaxID=653685 RepID=UPI00227E76C0|nr:MULTISPECIES: ATP-dependent helicase [Bacillus subtilis group]MCY8308630.1 ATP-dependent helicase [Bacillus vallismortis]MCY8518549.1 ATP-dependent helicase [Bacillus atrophaeus]MCY8599052.1 ATP-dependent helicase [Bacillus vallismortis]
MMNDILKGLNNEQKKAVLATDNALVIACPGSGKTRVLTRKIAYELNQITSSKQMIVAFTFTTNAAEEIYSRVEEMDLSTENLWIGTFHSFCSQWIIKPYGMYHNELNLGFSYATDYYQNKVLKEIKAESGLKFFDNVNTKFNRAGEYTNKIHKFNEVAKLYHQRLKEEKLIDYNQIIYFSYQLIKTHPKISINLSNLFKYILVDEYQDTQDLQYGIIGEIIKNSHGKSKLFMVGDPEQNIYSSIGGIAKTKDEIQKDLGDNKLVEVKLNGNYRSTQRIVDFCKSFQLEQREVVSLAVLKNSRGIITFDDKIHSNEVTDEIANLVRSYINKGHAPNEICIAAPQWFMLNQGVRKLKQALPDIAFAAPDLTPLPKQTDNFYSKLSRILCTPSSPKMYLHRLRWSKEIVEQLNETCNSSWPNNKSSCIKLLNLMKRCKSHQSNIREYLEQSFEMIMVELNLDFYTYPDLALMYQLFFEQLDEKLKIPEYPQDINSILNLHEPKTGIAIKSFHGVKGEEYETVIAFGLLEGYIPHWNEISDRTVSKRLLYVLCSRAKKNLHLFSETNRYTGKGYPYKTNRELKNVEFEYD